MMVPCAGYLVVWEMRSGKFHAQDIQTLRLARVASLNKSFAVALISRILHAPVRACMHAFVCHTMH
eukprot:8228330-Alexandrium_andersonii.AAC.1